MTAFTPGCVRASRPKKRSLPLILLGGLHAAKCSLNRRTLHKKQRALRIWEGIPQHGHRRNRTTPARRSARRRRCDFHAMGRPGKLEIIADQADGDAARPVARLFAGRRRARCRPSPRTRARAYDYTDERQSGRRHLQRHRHPRPRQSRRARLQAGDGRQGGAVQALRRRRLHRPRGRHRGRRRVHQLRALPRPDLRRHQPRGHQGARLLHHRAAPARADGHPGLPRRPARHRDHRRRRPDQRAATSPAAT